MAIVRENVVSVADPRGPFAVELTSSETSLGGLARSMLPGALAVSADGRRFGYLAETRQGTIVMVDGRVFGPFAKTMKVAPAFSADGRHFAFAAARGEHWAVSVDGVVQTAHAEITHRPVFSGDGRRMAYAARRGSGQFLVVDGNEVGPALAAILPGSVTFSPDGCHLACLGLQSDGSGALVLDGQAIASCEGFPPDARPVFSPDSHRLAYAASSSGERVVVDGCEGTTYDSLLSTPPIFSADSRSVAYRAHRDGRQFVVLGGVEGPAYDEVSDTIFSFSPVGSRLAYGAVAGTRAFLVSDGQEGRAYDSLLERSFAFSPDGQRAIYGARRDDRAFVVVDGREEGPYKDVANASRGLRFSGDGRRYAYAVSVDFEGLRTVVDGELGESFDEIAVQMPLFSPDGRRMAVAGARDGCWRVWLDGESGPSWDLVLGDTLSFSPDSRHLVYIAEKSGQVRLVVDTTVHPGSFDGHLCRPVFGERGRFCILMVRGGQVVRVEVEIG